MDGFIGSPFLLTATPETGAHWAGRPAVRAKVERLAKSMVVRPDSTLDVVWANFGSGKSHVLYHVAHLLQEHSSDVVSAFVEVPEQIKNFVDLYRRIMPKLPWKRLAGIVGADSDLDTSSYLKKAARVIEHGNDRERTLALDWLLANSVNLRDLKTYVGVQSRIETDIQAADTLGELLGVLSRREIRMVLLLDEFQRVGSLSERHRFPILSNLRSVFSRNPTYFSVVFAAATRLERTAMELIPAELRTLIGPRPIVSLPEMDVEEAMGFVKGRLAGFRAPDYSGDEFAPLREDIVRDSLDYLSAEARAKLIPRTILQAISLLYDECVIAGEAPSTSAVKSMLSSLSWQEA